MINQSIFQSWSQHIKRLPVLNLAYQAKLSHHPVRAAILSEKVVSSNYNFANYFREMLRKRPYQRQFGRYLEL